MAVGVPLDPRICVDVKLHSVKFDLNKKIPDLSGPGIFKFSHVLVLTFDRLDQDGKILQTVGISHSTDLGDTETPLEGIDLQVILRQFLAADVLKLSGKVVIVK